MALAPDTYTDLIMAVAKKARKEPSCPLWLATYGDMVTNMLVFFVLLLSMSEIKKEELFIEFMRTVREAFGYIGGLEQIPLETVMDVRNVPLAETLIIPIHPEDLSPSPDEGVVGKHNKVVKVRPPDRYDQGGKFNFSELSAELTDDVRNAVSAYAENLRGLRTQIEVRGHCNPRPVDGSAFRDHYDLSYRRAHVVADELIRCGVDPARIVVVAASTHEPVTRRNYTSVERQANDLVEVVQINRRVDEFEYNASEPDTP